MPLAGNKKEKKGKKKKKRKNVISRFSQHIGKEGLSDLVKYLFDIQEADQRL